MDMIQVYRQEIKYQASVLEFKKIEHQLRACMLEDPHNGKNGGYTVRSLYFDSPYEQDRLAVLRGGEKRHKIRLRIYDPEDTQVKLELKAKEGTVQKKSSVLLTRDQAKEIMAGDFTLLRHMDSPIAQHIYLVMQEGQYRPRVLMEYDRTAYYLPSRETRVTFDYNARASRLNLDLFAEDICFTPLRPASIGVVEVKFDGYLYSYIKNIVSGLDRLPSSNGKYLFACNL